MDGLLSLIRVKIASLNHFFVRLLRFILALIITLLMPIIILESWFIDYVVDGGRISSATSDMIKGWWNWLTFRGEIG